MMCGILRASLLFACLILAGFAPLHAQSPPPQPAPEKVEKSEPPPAPPAAPAKYERDGTTMLVHYLLAGIATIMILALICMPVRRE